MIGELIERRSQNNRGLSKPNAPSGKGLRSGRPDGEPSEASEPVPLVRLLAEDDPAREAQTRSDKTKIILDTPAQSILGKCHLSIENVRS